MPSYGFIISLGDLNIQQFAHDTGTSIRAFCSGNTSWSPYYVTGFDPTTGLPLPDVLGATEVQNPCSLAADATSLYLLDTMTCRVLRFQPDTATVHATLGGKRGVGTGRITPDPTLRSIVAIANRYLWVTDNEGGYLVQYRPYAVGTSPANVWLADYSIATVASAAGVTVDQVTGIAWDAGRGCYWLLASGSAATYLIECDTTMTPNSSVLDLTARLGIAGHGGTGAGRVATRGLLSRQGKLYLWSGLRLYRVDPSGTDTLLYTGTSPLSPGSLSATEVTLGLQSEANGVNSLIVLDLASLTTRGYAPSDLTPDGGAGDVSAPWDHAVTPGEEDTAARLLQPVTARASIRNTTARTVTAKANLRARVALAADARARLLRGVQQQATARARIEEPDTIGSSQVESWDVTDSFGSFSQGFSLATRKIGIFQVGNEVRVKAGYDGSRMTVIVGKIDSVAQTKLHGERGYRLTGRNAGAQEYSTEPITKVWNAQPPTVTPWAHDIVREAASMVGLSVGVLEFPNYPLYSTLSVIGSPIFQVVQQLIEPWNQFARVQYTPVVRERALSILKIDWQNPPANGYLVERRFHADQELQQEAYLDEPRLDRVQAIYVRGAAYTKPKPSVAETRVEYFRNVTAAEVVQGVFGSLQTYVQTETVVSEVVAGDKVLSRDERIYTSRGQSPVSFGAAELTSRTVDTFFYYEPGTDVTTTNVGLDAITYQSETPSENALLLATTSRRYGLVELEVAIGDGAGGQAVDDSGNPLTQTVTFFELIFEGSTVYQYDEEHQIASEASTTLDYDYDIESRSATSGSGATVTASGLVRTQTGPRLDIRTHSQTSGGSLRTQLSQFSFEESKFTLDSVSVQQIGGTRPSFNNPSSKQNVQAVQVQAPQGAVDSEGNVIDLDEGKFVWTYESPYLGPKEADTLYALALAERDFQLQGWKWERVPFTSSMNPNLFVGQPVQIEIEAGVRRAYWVESVRHSGTPSALMSSGIAARLTLEDISEDDG